MELTIIVTTMPERSRLLSRCLWHLQHQTRQDFEVIVHKGDFPKGDKLMRAFPRVETSHLMMVDDDDYISPALVENVLPHDEDFVGYDALQMVDGAYTTVIHQEIASHICPIRSDLAREVPFGNEYLADIKWTKKVAKLVDTNVHLDEVYYFYDKWNPPGHVTGWSPPRPVGPWPYDPLRFMWL